MMLFPCRATSPSAEPSRGRSRPSESTTRTRPEMMLPTPWRARRTAWSETGSWSHSLRQSQIATGPKDSVSPYR